MTWQPIETIKGQPDQAVLLFYARRTWTTQDDDLADLGPVRFYAERIAVAFLNGGALCDQGTAHDIYERWRIENDDTPTHWMPLPPPPEVT